MVARERAAAFHWESDDAIDAIKSRGGAITMNRSLIRYEVEVLAPGCLPDQDPPEDPAKVYATLMSWWVLSDEPIPQEMGVDEIQRHCEEGDYVGSVSTQCEVGLGREDGIAALEALGSSAEFFDLEDSPGE